MKAHFQMFAGYNAWANGCLYAAAADLTEPQYRENRGAFFKSVHGTLNHLLTTDRIWMQRITGGARRRTGWTRSCSRTSPSCARHGRARTAASSAISTAWTKPLSPA